MELLGIEESRVVELLAIVRPQGQLHLPTTIEKIQEEFHFSQIPASLQEAKDGGLTFSDGIFGSTAIEELSIYTDGIVITSKSPTKFLESALAHLKKWAIAELGVQILKTHDVDTFYESQIVFSSERNVLGVLDGLAAVKRQFEEELHKNTKHDARYESFGFSFAVDPQISLIRPTMFRVERKAGLSFGFNTYFSTAPLKTDSHIKVINSLEAQI